MPFPETKKPRKFGAFYLSCRHIMLNGGMDEFRHIGVRISIGLYEIRISDVEISQMAKGSKITIPGIVNILMLPLYKCLDFWMVNSASNQRNQALEDIVALCKQCIFLLLRIAPPAKLGLFIFSVICAKLFDDLLLVNLLLFITKTAKVFFFTHDNLSL